MCSKNVGCIIIIIIIIIIIVILIITDRVSCVQKLLAIYYHNDTYKPLQSFVFNTCQIQNSISGLQKINLRTISTEHAVLRPVQKTVCPHCTQNLYSTRTQQWCYFECLVAHSQLNL